MNVLPSKAGRIWLFYRWAPLLYPDYSVTCQPVCLSCSPYQELHLFYCWIAQVPLVLRERKLFFCKLHRKKIYKMNNNNKKQKSNQNTTMCVGTSRNNKKKKPKNQHNFILKTEIALVTLEAFRTPNSIMTSTQTASHLKKCQALHRGSCSLYLTA